MAKQKKPLGSKPAEGVSNLSDSLITTALIILLALIPVFVRLAKISHVSPLIHDPWLDTGDYGDLVTYYKFILLVSGTLCIFGIFLYRLFKEKRPLSRRSLNMPAALLLMFIVLSYLFSPLKTFAVFGQFDQWEGGIAYLCYLTLLIIVSDTHIAQNKLVWLFYALFPLTIINALFELSFFYGSDPIQWSLIRALVLPQNLASQMQAAEIHLYSTIGNHDFVSGIAGVTTAMFLFLSVFTDIAARRAAFLAMSVLSFALLLASQATSGFLAFLLILPLLCYLIMVSKNKRARAVTAGAAICLFALVFILLNLHTNEVWQNTFGFFSSSRGSVSQSLDPVTNQPAVPESTDAGSLPEFQLPAKAWSAGTGRLYIWQKTLKLIKERPLFGYGLGTLAYFFPQDDPAKAAGIDNPDTIVDKPHNLYLNLAYGAGVFALLSFIALIVLHFWRHLALLKQPVEGETKALQTAIFIGWLVYLVQGMFNDSVIGTSIIFWILFGVSASIFEKNAAADNSNVKAKNSALAKSGGKI